MVDIPHSRGVVAVTTVDQDTTAVDPEDFPGDAIFVMRPAIWQEIVNCVT